jgi:hypothetical protein
MTQPITSSRVYSIIGASKSTAIRHCSHHLPAPLALHPQKEESQEQGSIISQSIRHALLLDQKAYHLAYHFVREHQSKTVVSIRKMETKDNYADPFTKALNHTEFHAFHIQLLHN